MSQSRLNILIIGGGIGGLTLGQALLQHNISFRIFERDTSVTYRSQGYRIRISGDGVHALQKCLPQPTWEKLEASAATGMIGMTKIDALTGEVAPKPITGNGELKGMRHDAKPIAVDRTVMRTVLLSGLEGHIEFGKTFEGYDITDSGIKATFTDGTSYDGDTLVGADGSNSLVRKQYLPQLKVIDTTGRCIYGKTYITPELEEAFTPKAMKNMTIIQQQRPDGTPLTLFLEPTRFPNSGLVPIINPKTGEEEYVKDYVYWVLLSKAHDSLSPTSQFHYLTSAEAAELSVKVTRSWHASVKPVLALQSSTSTSALRIVSAVPDMPAWEPSRFITLLGDAAHPLPPTAGLGAVSALRDVELLLDAILKGVSGESIGEYELEMRKWACEVVQASKKGAEKFIGGWDWDTVQV
ncbi:cercosporin toxin biosynthesis protein [Lophiotrema nucula]|uniref:Cercosporin toxin biosynthesis protein n=1 Tax=Lophiotrema nucula TaxID=690887 RepID=A0A6A5YHY3_9PLEO|nr:cercosporin toxin biosynthesis protein [Lophiotrema nucula]